MGKYLLENYLRCCSVMYKLKTKTAIFKDKRKWYKGLRYIRIKNLQVWLQVLITGRQQRL